MIAIVLALALATVQAVPVEDGGVDRYTKVHSFSSAMSDIDGDRQEESYVQDGAELNGQPMYLMNGGEEADNDDVHQAYDLIMPQNNLHSHLDRYNDQEVSFDEPLNEEQEEELADFIENVEDNENGYENEDENLDYYY